MAKIRKCDICGKCQEGRNPDGFHEVARYRKTLTIADGYSDLCDECYDEYMEVHDGALRVCRDTINAWFMEKGDE